MTRAMTEGFLFTDQYQLTMAQLYFREGLHERPAQFEHYFRANPDYGPHQAGYCVNAGMEWLLDWMESARITGAEIEVLRSHRSAGGEQVFGNDFLAWLGQHGSFEQISLRAIPEGRVVHPNVPLAVVRGPLAVAQILETSLLAHCNHQTLIATKACRVAEAARGRPVLEFGMRRGAERGANAATRAALIGGATATSNVGVGHYLGLPPAGTHAHSLVQAFMALGRGELGAFRAYAATYPDTCLLLVDTIDTLGSGVPNAIRVFEELRAQGHRPVGIRLDSGDLAYLAVQSSMLLDQAGFDEVGIVLSSSLDEITIFQILAQIDQEAGQYGVDTRRLLARLSFGVGSRMSTSDGKPYLDGVYKLVAIHDERDWVPAIKISDNPMKVQTPGNKDVYRLYDRRGLATADVVAVAGSPLPTDPLVLRHPFDQEARRSLHSADVREVEPLLAEVLVDGRRKAGPATIDELRARRAHDLARLDPGVRRLVNPHTYHVSLTEELLALRQRLIGTAR
jgi:nicotinate phosphoribosyltransferase